MMNRIKGPKKNSLFLERSIMSALDFFKQTIISEEAAGYGAFLQKIDTKVKMPAFLICISVVCMTPDRILIATLYLFSVLLAFFSGIRITVFLKRVWLFIPLFTLVIAIPAVFIYDLSSAVVFVLRVAASVSFAVLFTMTTKNKDLFSALRFFRVPSVFIMVLEMTYRYIFLFVKVFEEMHIGLKARLVCHLGSRFAYRWVSSRIASLFIRSMKMSEEVYYAMLARGYRNR